MKRSSKKIISLIMSLMIVFSSNGIFSSIYAENNVKSTDKKGYLTIDKKANKKEEGIYTITLDAEGKKKEEQPISADIVVMIDKSGSMSDKIGQVKQAVNSFTSNLLNSGNKNINIAIATFDYSEHEYWNKGYSSNVVQNFINNLSTITREVDKIGVGGGTNTQDGIWRVAEMLKGRNASKQYVVFFTDGLPTQSYNGGTGHNSLDGYFKDAQREYYSHFTGYNSPTSVTIGGIGRDNAWYNYIGKAEKLNVEPNKVTHKNTKFYSVGLFTNATKDEQEQAIKFLKTIQNVINPNDFASKYYTQNLNSINGIFNDISNEIKVNINNSVANDVEVSDIVTKDFSIIENSWKIVDLEGKEILLPEQNIIISKTANGEDKITFKLGDIVAGTNGVGGVKITFDVKVKDEYFYGKNIDTNVEADIKYIDPHDKNNYEQIYPIPKVDIPPKLGSIKVSKEVVGKDNSQDEFFIKIKGIDENNKNEEHDFTIKSGEQQTLDVILKKDDGKIDKEKTHLAIGKYSVAEYNIPNGYELENIIINDKPMQSDRTFIIDKNNPNINIKVVNKFTLNKVSTFDIDKTAKKLEDDVYEIKLKVDGSVSFDKAQAISSDEIEGSIIGENVTIEDIVTKYFTIIDNSWKITDLNGDNINLSSDKVNIDKSREEEKISFNIGTILADSKGKGGVIITFKVKSKDIYFGGEDIATNVKAELNYRNPYEDKDKREEFPVPTVDIPFKKGSITIKKEIVKQDSNGQWISVSDDEINKNDKFSISVVGKSTYTVDLSGNEKTTLDFYLKDENTDISNNDDMSTNYINIGKYNIEELVSMNYEQVKLFIDVSTDPLVEKWQEFDGSFTIDKDNPNISIKVCNTLTNKKYFNDKASAENIFIYNPEKNFLRRIINLFSHK